VLFLYNNTIFAIIFVLKNKKQKGGVKMKGKIKFFRGVLLFLGILSLIMAGAWMAGTVGKGRTAEAATTTVTITKSGGWLESAYAEWPPVSGATGYNVYYKPAGAADSQYVKIDAALVRQYSTRYRADVLGLSAGNYVIKIVPTANGAEIASAAGVTSSLAVKAHTREGFAFSPHSPMKTGSGGYNDNGTVPGNAQIIYVTSKTANTVTLDVITNSKGTKTTCTGLANILSARQKGYDKTPLIIRFIGMIKDSDISGLNSSGYIQVKGCYNVTLEGVGEDTTAYGWGILVREAHNVEIRNLGFMMFKDDAVSIDTNNENIWVHNNDFFYGAPGSDADQVKGDGSCDVKGFSDYVTISYNHFWDSGKASLCGMSDSKEFHVTYHHNWFDHSDSRHPRIRKGTVHIYNNYFDGVSKYGVGNTNGGSAFVEANYFRNCKYPMLISLQGTDIYGGSKGTFSSEPGGMIKAYNNTVIGATRLVYHTSDSTQFDAYLATSRNEQVPSTYRTVSGGNTYNNFDTASTMYSYTPHAPSEVVNVVTTYAGRVNGGDFKWTFTAADDTDSDVNTALKTAILNYKPDQQTVNAPSAPSSVTASAGNAQVTLTWSASSGATSYNVKRATVSGGPYTTIKTGLTSTSYTDTGLTNGTRYYYVVSAVNSAGESGNSYEVSAVPVASMRVPSAPTNRTATAGNAQVTLTWSASSGANSYKVKRATVSGGPYTTIKAGLTSTSYTDTGLTNGTRYYYVVSAVNSAGESSNSSQVSAVPTGSTSSTIFSDNFNSATTNTLFTAGYKSLASNSSTPMYYKLGGTITVSNGAVALDGGRFTIGNKTPTVSTSSSDKTTTGELDLSRPYVISFKVTAVSGSTSKQLIVYVDNNTTSGGSSIHGSNSKIYSSALSSLKAGQTVTISSSVGTATSFIQIRTESSAVVTIDDLVITYQ